MHKEVCLQARVYIMIFLLLFVAQTWAQSSVGVLAACTQVKCSPQSSSSSVLTQFAHQCAIESKALKCDELAKENPAQAGLVRKCDVSGLCAQAEDNTATDEMKACLRGYTNSLIDTGIALKDMAMGLGKQIDAAWENIKNNEKLRSEFVSQCNQSLACKKDLVKEDPRYSSLSDEELSKISASALYVQVRDRKAYLDSIHRSVMTAKPPEMHPTDTELTTEQKSKLADLSVIIKAKLKKEYQKFNCYNPKAQAEMACYAVGQVIDPTLLAGAAFKGARAVKALGKVAEESSEVARTVAVAEKSAAVSRADFIKKYVDYNPTTVAQNEKFIELAEKGKEANAYFVNIENSQMKYLNDTLKDKNLVTSLTNYHKDLVLKRLEELKKEFPDLKVSEYSDFKSLRFAFEGKVPADLEKRMAALFKDANNEFTNYLVDNKMLRQQDHPDNYFKAGYGRTADEAGTAARYARKTTPGEMASYSNSKLKSELSATVQAVEADRVSLRQQLGQTKLIDGETFKPEVFDIVRKNMGNTKTIQTSLKNRYKLATLSESTVQDLQRYVKTSDEFSPGLMIAKRESANLNDATAGGFTMDFVGLGASNMKGTAEALAKSKDVDTALSEARKAEKAVTSDVNAQKQFFNKVVTESVEPGKIKSVCSGDDCVAIAAKPISEQEKVKVLSRVADSKYASKMRFAFVNDGVKSAETRNSLSTHGESIEKLLRKNLGSQMDPNKLEGVTFGIDMRTDTLNQGSVKLLMGQSPDLYLTKLEQKRIQEAFKKSVEEFNKTAYKSGPAPRYEASP
ncbi:hypothetical protein B9G69_002195 [Bdellovibrio sp. SKB1291214]|uniref:hypothetical protein n=1 Tax=Bdellovibrio sp. SKB1291214 TaxID=1732569 RepID=UPI001C3CE2DC|nr:hypothetical protein [Bdellovibrio sp. SKB1291214]UYL09382.1 hypothetical protein B9G69_002195 [Bdellovibrio sp. SKB1291214]